MPKNKKLEKKITYKLEKLQELLDNISETQNIDPDDPDTWDSDTLYNLISDLEESLTILKDKESQTEKDNFGSPLSPVWEKRVKKSRNLNFYGN